MFVNTISHEPLEISSRTVRGIILESKGGQAKFENNYFGSVRLVIDLTSDVLLCNVGAPWRTTTKELTHMITDPRAGGEKTSI